MTLWDNNEIQFARLLCEMRANCHISGSDWDDLCESMDLTEDEVGSLLDRAHEVWEQSKKNVHN